MSKPETEDLILKELRAIRNVLERLFAATQPPQAASEGERKPQLFANIKGIDTK